MSIFSLQSKKAEKVMLLNLKLQATLEKHKQLMILMFSIIRSYRILVSPLTCTMLEMSIGNIESGNRRMLKSASETKAVVAFRTLFSSTMT